MASQAVRAHGTLLQRSDGAGGWTTIAEQVNIDWRARADEINISIHNEPDAWGNFLPGPKSAEVGFTANFLADDATHDAQTGLLKMFMDGSKDTFRLAWNTFTPAVFWTFTAFVREFNIPAPAGQAAALQFTTTMRIDGAPTLA
ncbi:MAG TPA: phage tail tube protein [Alphaproteobacteria bacterium]|nr:phage tail tube protein [Alphaproteobacteria bacterium]